MVPRTWLLRVIFGLLLLALFGGLTAVTVQQQRDRSGPPVDVSVAEATARVEAGETLVNARLTDLALDCETLTLVQKQGYVAGYGAGGAGLRLPMVLVDHGEDTRCVDGPAWFVGAVTAPDILLLAELRLTMVPHVVLLRPHTGSAVADLVIVGVLDLLALWLVVSGLRRRRAEREALRRIVEDPAVVLADVRPGAGDPYREVAGGRWLLPGPLRLSDAWVRGQRRGGLIATVVSTLLFCGAAWLAVSATGDVLRTRRVWSTGASATDVEVNGDASTRWLFVIEDADLTVAYTDSAGRRRHGQVSRHGFGELNTRPTPAVRHAVDDPDDFVLSWVHDALPGEIALYLLFLGVLVGGGFGSRAAARKGRLELAAVRGLLASDPEEVALAVVGTRPLEVNEHHVGTVYTLQIPGGGSFELSMSHGEFPLFLELDQSRVLGLRRSGDLRQALVVREDLRPLAAPHDEAERVRLRWRAGKHPPGKPSLDDFIRDKFTRPRG